MASHPSVGRWCGVEELAAQEAVGGLLYRKSRVNLSIWELKAKI